MATGTLGRLSTRSQAIRRRRFNRSDLLLYILLLPAVIATVLPIAYMISQSLTPERDSLAWPIEWIPRNPTLNNFERLFNDPTLPVFRWLVNSLFVSLGVTALVLVIDSLTAYAFARLTFPGRDFIFFCLLISLMIPGHITLIPTFLLMRNLNFLDTYHALIWNHGAGVFGIFLLRQYFLSIPRELEEAAMVDGSSRFGAFRQIVLPLSLPGLLAAGVFAFVLGWNEFLFALVLTGREAKTLPVALASLMSSQGDQIGAICAATVAMMAPIVALTWVIQRFLVRGLTFGAVK